MFRFLQDYPQFLARVYDGLHQAILPFRRWLQPNGRLEPLVIWGEEVGKGAVFDCQMCGQCILHSTGMTCPMTCPKNLRNGPCGGVRANGHCEVKPDMKCIWTVAYERSLQMPVYGPELIQIQPPVNRRLEGTASWINMLAGLDMVTPDSWEMPETDLPVTLALPKEGPAVAVSSDS